MNEQEIRKHVFAAYGSSLGKSYGDIRTYVAARKAPPHELSGAENRIFRNVMWDLAMQGVIAPLGPELDTLLHSARLTDYGLECIAQEQVLPHDIDGYLTNLRDSMGDEADKMLLQYAEEALECFHRSNLRAAVVLLGVAAERSLELLKDAYLQTLEEKARPKALSKLNDRNLRKRFDNLWKRIKAFEIPGDLQDKREGDFWGTFQLIRRSRNEAGHFSPVETDKLTALACLSALPGYIRTLVRLVEHFRTAAKGGSENA